MPNGDDKNWSRLCVTLDRFFAQHGRWPRRVRLGAQLLGDLRDHIFTPKAWTAVTSKLDFIIDERTTIVAEDDRARIEYGDAPDRGPRPSASEWLGVQPDAVGRPAAPMPRLLGDANSLLNAARQALEGGEVVRSKGMDGVQRATFDHDDQAWVVCRAPQNRGCARLIDVAAAYREEQRACGAVAVLAPSVTESKGKSALPEQGYVRQYQSAVWYGLGMVFVVDASAGTLGADWAPLATAPARGDFDALADVVLARLHEDSANWIPCEDSREVEGLVRISVHRALAEHGFERSLRSAADPKGGKAYQGFWRRAEADGVWTRTSGSPARIALEVKMNEDVEAPLCQVLDDLGHSDGVINVRAAGGKTDYRNLAAVMEVLSERLPARYIELG